MNDIIGLVHSLSVLSQFVDILPKVFTLRQALKPESSLFLTPLFFFVYATSIFLLVQFFERRYRRIFY